MKCANIYQDLARHLIFMFLQLLCYNTHRAHSILKAGIAQNKLVHKVV